MRDGVHLFTAVYVPKDSSQVYPFLVTRKPYSSSRILAMRRDHLV